MRALFDRIAEPLPYTIDPEENVNQTAASVRDELNRLLNCRSFFGDRRTRARDTILNYGLRDLSSIDNLPVASRATLASRVRQAIARYEPRLSDIGAVIVDRKPAQPATVEISARIKTEDRSIRFVVPIGMAD